MADRMLFIGWQSPARGMETRATDVFNEVLSILGRRQQEQAIESFDVALMAPNGSLGGYVAIKGSAEQINALREDDDFQRTTVDAELCVDGIVHLLGVCNSGIAEQMGLFQERAAAMAHS